MALSKTDGRLGRSERSRAAVASAMLALIVEGDLRPTAPRIAARAGVSLRLVFHHFKDLEAVFADAAKRQLERVIPTLRTVAAEGPLQQRIDALVSERARLYEEVANTWRAAVLQEPFSTEISRRMAMVRGWLRDDAERVFAPELAARSTKDGKELQAALAAASGMAGWEELRRHQGLSIEPARRAMARMLAALLSEPPKTTRPRR
ncbi:MAG TPA: TetR/AcrR family transcriptional regulator [Polyangia bacterium]|jgi:AcrR family transcriptional regulator